MVQYHLLCAIPFSGRSPNGGARADPAPAIPCSFLFSHAWFVQLVPDSGGGEGEADGTGGLSEPERLMGRVLEQPGTVLHSTCTAVLHCAVLYCTVRLVLLSWVRKMR